MMKPALWTGLALLVLAGLLALMFQDRLATADGYDVQRLIYLILLGVLVGAGLFGFRMMGTGAGGQPQLSFGKIVQYLIAWGAILTALFLAFQLFGQEWMANQLSGGPLIPGR